ncbi:carboxypeptidase-like regulatory domain-containing protein [Bacteroides timonensis]|uniref:carboxypeptidase-like regulatory domain-containing protein n=1 Tax=Bacteroides timonensis TaxID=1470345 RepID=UPI0004B7A5FE|nr:carboxypeptidase-like regulatory domain-containing protein [Bacteroides timonensis]
MKKLLLLGFFLSLGGFYLSAQNTVSGIVTDKKGNPIPGAKVEIKGGTESTITELDGTFTLETKTPAQKVKVYYVGMQAKEQKVKPDMLIKMSDSSWWREKPDKYRWLVGVQMAVPDDCLELTPSFGLMLGRVKNIGWYVKGVYSKKQSTAGSMGEEDYYWTTGKSKCSYVSATGGVIVRLWSPIYLYAGAGYFDREAAWQLANGDYYKYSPDTYSGVAADFGVMLKIKRFFINAGATYGFPLDGGYDSTKKGVGNFGVGMYF